MHILSSMSPMHCLLRSISILNMEGLILRIYLGSNRKIVKNIEAQRKLRYSYKIKVCIQNKLYIF